MNKAERDQTYVIPLDYGDRDFARNFLRALLARYDKDTLVGCALFVNNHPYNLESYLCLNFWENNDFEHWLGSHFPKLKRDYRFLSSEIANGVFSRAFNVITFTDSENLDIQISDEPNGIYLFPSRKLMDERFGKPIASAQFLVFLSHSSADKPLVDRVFQALHQSGVRAWYDRYEIQAGDSITSKINDGLDRSELGLLFLSKNFFNSKSGWTAAEANFFFQQRMRDPKKRFLVVNLDMEHHEIPPLLQDYRYISWASTGAIDEIVNAVKAAQPIQANSSR